MRFKSLHHVAVRSSNFDRSKSFYCGVLGLEANPRKPNWLGWPGGEHYSVHLMPAMVSNVGENDDIDLGRHLALEVEHLRPVVAALLAAGLSPFQTTLGGERRSVASADQDFSFGIGTLFVIDPDGNAVEFVDTKAGIFADVD